MTSHTIDYAETLAKLTAMVGEQVDLSVRGVDGSPPQVLFYTGSSGGRERRRSTVPSPSARDSCRRSR